jgi:hypothetical protein
MTHTATIAQFPGFTTTGYLVTCPHGCNLGDSARQATREGAEQRVALHQLATRPLTPAEPFGVPDPDCRTCGGTGRVYVAPGSAEVGISTRCPDCPGDPTPAPEIPGKDHLS